MDLPDLQQFLRGQLMIVRWRRTTLEATGQLRRSVDNHFQAEGRKLFFAAIIGVDCPPPSPEIREALLTNQQASWPRCETMHMVILGSGMGRALIRSVLTGMGLASALRGRGFAVDGSIRELASAAESTTGADPSELIAALTAAGLVSAEEALS